MKKLTFILVCLLTLCTTTACADNEKPIQVSQLPAAAQELISRHFAGSKVAMAKVESGLASKSYEVVFADGAKLDFDGKGNWKEIDCKLAEVPEALVPAQIKNYVQANYPDAKVIKIEKDRKEYEVKLSNRMELKFDRNFRLIDIDI